MRRVVGCMNCGETREIAAHGLCFKCYRQSERANDKPDSRLDRHNPGVRREHKKLFRGFNSLMASTSDLGVSATGTMAIRQIIDPYLAPIAKFLATTAPSDQKEQPCEQVNDIQESVHSSQEAERDLTVANPELDEMTGADSIQNSIAVVKVQAPRQLKTTVAMIETQQRKKNGALRDLIRYLSGETVFDKDGNPISFEVKRHMITIWRGSDTKEGGDEYGRRS